MTDEDYARKLDELDRLLNDPDTPMQPARIWALLGELPQHEMQADLVSARGRVPQGHRTVKQ